MRDARGMNEFTKESIDKNIDDFCESVYQEIEFNASNGYFNCKLKFQGKIVPYKNGNSGLFYVAERLKNLGYIITDIQLPTEPKTNGKYKETEDCYIKVSWKEASPNVEDTIETVVESLNSVSNQVFETENDENAIQYTVPEG